MSFHGPTPIIVPNAAITCSLHTFDYAASIILMPVMQTGPNAGTPALQVQYNTFVGNMWNHYYTQCMQTPPDPQRGCNWLANRVTHWSNQLISMNPNSYGYALKSAKISWAQHMLSECQCHGYAKLAKDVISKKLTSLAVDTSNISNTGEIREIKVIGDPGAQFTLTIKNAAGTSKLSSSGKDYDSNGNIIDTTLPTSGVYSFKQVFPGVSASDKYKIQVTAKIGTIFGRDFQDYILINQWYPTTLTLTAASASNSSSYDSSGSGYGITNVTIKNEVTVDSVKNSARVKNLTKSEISWELTGASGAAITLSRQPIATDFSNNIANEFGEIENTFFDVKALSNSLAAKIVVSDADADKLTTSMIVKEEAKAPPTDIEKAAKVIEDKVVEETLSYEDAKDLSLEKEAAKKAGYKSALEYEKSKSKTVEEKAELEGGETTVKEVTISAIDTTNNVVTLSTSQSVKYGDILRYTNGGTVVDFRSLKAKQIAASVILITADVHLVSMGVQSVTSTLTLDNFITV